MPTRFEEKKQKILAQLSTPEDAYSDLSPKGSVDEGVRELCDEINALDGFVTTSSCAGRIAVYLEGRQSKVSAEEEVGEDEQDAARPAASSGGKGGGEWFYVSHDPMSSETISNAKSTGGLLKLFGIDSDEKPSSPSNLDGIRFVHFRFEPMILHILTSTPHHATHALSSGLQSGFRESGISSLTTTPLVAIRTQGLFLSSIIAYQTTPTSPIKHMVSEEYLTTLVELANQRFVANGERKERFRRALLKLNVGGVGKAEAENWEPTEERRERKRAEGLRRREEEMRRREVAAEDGGDNEDRDYFAAELALDPDSDARPS